MREVERVKRWAGCPKCRYRAVLICLAAGAVIHLLKILNELGAF